MQISNACGRGSCIEMWWNLFQLFKDVVFDTKLGKSVPAMTRVPCFVGISALEDVVLSCGTVMTARNLHPKLWLFMNTRADTIMPKIEAYSAVHFFGGSFGVGSQAFHNLHEPTKLCKDDTSPVGVCLSPNEQFMECHQFLNTTQATWRTLLGKGLRWVWDWGTLSFFLSFFLDTIGTDREMIRKVERHTVEGLVGCGCKAQRSDG